MIHISERVLAKMVATVVKYRPPSMKDIDFRASRKRGVLEISSRTTNWAVIARVKTEVEKPFTFSVAADVVAKLFRSTSAASLKVENVNKTGSYTCKGRNGIFNTVQFVDPPELILEPNDDLPQSFLFQAAKLHEIMRIEGLYKKESNATPPDVLLKINKDKERAVLTTGDNYHIVCSEFRLSEPGIGGFRLNVPQAYMDYFSVFQPKRAYISKSGLIVLRAEADGVEYTFALPPVSAENNVNDIAKQMIKEQEGSKTALMPFEFLDALNEDVLKSGIADVHFSFDKGECLIKGVDKGREINIKRSDLSFPSGSFSLSANQLKETISILTRIYKAQTRKAAKGKGNDTEKVRLSATMTMAPKAVLLHMNGKVDNMRHDTYLVLARTES